MRKVHPHGEWTPDGATAEDYGNRRLQDLADYSGSLRIPMIATAFVIAALIVTGGWSVWIAGAWAIACLSVRELQIIMLVRLAESSRPAEERMHETACNKLLLGCMHGGSALFMWKMTGEVNALLTMILMSLSAGSVSTTFMIPRGFVAYAAAVSLPTAAMWFLSGSWLGAGVGTLVLMFFGVQLRFARQNLKMYEESYFMRLENVELLQSLTEERKRLAQARDVAVQADRSKSRFLASASHDLRQPLQSLSLNSGALSRIRLEGDARIISEEIGSSIEALRRMLDALLDVSKLDAGEVNPVFQQIPLGRLLQGLSARFRLAAQAKGLRFDCRCALDLLVISDADLLQRVLSNLIDNAIKFTNSGSVVVSAEPVEGGVQVIVSDTGSGIETSSKERVFEDLVQLGNLHRDRSVGSGLGLGIVRRLADLLGIRYEMVSAIGHGTHFHLWLPVGTEGAAIVSENTDELPSLAARRVLVLDDDFSVRAAYKQALQSQGCEVKCVATLGEAMDEMNSLRPEVALVDFRLDDRMNGLEAIGRLRSIHPGLAAIIVSADMSAELREEAARTAVRVLRKPVTDAILTAAINKGLHEPALSPGSR